MQSASGIFGYDPTKLLKEGGDRNFVCFILKNLVEGIGQKQIKKI